MWRMDGNSLFGQKANKTSGEIIQEMLNSIIYLSVIVNTTDLSLKSFIGQNMRSLF